MTSDSPLRVDVTPREAYEQRPRLFAALEAAFPVKFQVTGSGDADAAIVFATRAASSEAVSGPTPTLVGAAQNDQPLAAIGFTDSGSVPGRSGPHANGLVTRTGTSRHLRQLGPGPRKVSKRTGLDGSRKRAVRCSVMARGARARGHAS